MKVTTKIIFTHFVLIVCSFEIYAQNSNCKKLGDDETTRQGYSATIVYKSKEKFQSIRGTAVFSSKREPAEEVFVELFSDKSDKRIIGCQTDVTGKFSFPNIPDGKYTIRLSRDGGFAVSEIQVKVSAKSKNTKEIVGVVNPGS